MKKKGKGWAVGGGTGFCSRLRRRRDEREGAWVGGIRWPSWEGTRSSPSHHDSRISDGHWLPDPPFCDAVTMAARTGYEP